MGLGHGLAAILFVVGVSGYAGSGRHMEEPSAMTVPLQMVQADVPQYSSTFAALPTRGICVGKAWSWPNKIDFSTGQLTAYPGEPNIKGYYPQYATLQYEQDGTAHVTLPQTGSTITYIRNCGIDAGRTVICARLNRNNPNIWGYGAASGTLDFTLVCEP